MGLLLFSFETNAGSVFRCQKTTAPRKLAAFCLNYWF